jgi:hypothetical protein
LRSIAGARREKPPAGVGWEGEEGAGGRFKAVEERAMAMM